MRSRSGVYCFARWQGKYKGDWVDDNYDGYGIEALYHGHYHRGINHGFRAYMLQNGDSYTREWVAGWRHGRGVQGFPDGSSYVGEFQCGAKRGLSYYHFRNGDTGKYFVDRIRRFGAYYYIDGQYYVGSLHKGQRQGFRAYTFESGEAMSGEWDCVTLPLEDPNVERTIQLAQRALERTLLLPSAEEQVGMVVARGQIAAVFA